MIPQLKIVVFRSYASLLEAMPYMDIHGAYYMERMDLNLAQTRPRQARPDSVSSSAWRVAWDVLRRQGPQGLYRGAVSHGPHCLGGGWSTVNAKQSALCCWIEAPIGWILWIMCQCRAENLTKMLGQHAMQQTYANLISDYLHPALRILHVATGGLPVVLGGTMFRSAQFGFYEAALGTELPGYRLDCLKMNVPLNEWTKKGPNTSTKWKMVKITS